MAYVPPHLRKKTAAAAPAPPARVGVRFIGNATGASNEAENNGRRHSPHKNAATRKATLKRSVALTPNSSPLARPTTRISKMPAKFREAIHRAIGHEKTKKTRKHRRSRVTRRHHAKYTKR
jgi:hypothetical protein